MSVDLQNINIERFFSDFEGVVQRNDVGAAGKIAQRIIKTFGAQPVNSQNSPLFALPLFHQQVISILDKADNAAASKMRNELSKYYFTGNWLGKRELCKKVGDPKFAEAFYYHVTSFEGLKGILSTGKIRAQQSFYYGAFVGMGRPVWFFGKYAIALNKNIEKASGLLTRDRENYINGIGFSVDIKVDETTLSHVILAKKERFRGLRSPSIEELTNLCRGWAGRDVLVVPELEAQKFIKKIYKFGLGIPIEWGLSDYYNRDSRLIKAEWRDSPFLPSKL